MAFKFQFANGYPGSYPGAWVFNLDRDGNIINEEQERKDQEFERFMEGLQ